MVEAEQLGRVGELLAGKYKLLQLLGEGGMGQVYRAENTLLGRPVAIKTLLREFASNAQVLARFYQEGRAANVVRHPNVVDVLDVGQADDGTPFIVQELLEGQTLASKTELSGGRLPEDELLAYVVPIVDVMALAHERGLVHRDIKPENIFLTRDANVIVPKLLDFGLAKLSAAPGAARVTRSGESFGTPAYMSPEQVLGHEAGPASDVWSLGVVLYEGLSGWFPFNATTGNEFMVQIATERAIPLAKRFPGVSPALAELVMQCLVTRAEERVAHAGILSARLRDVVPELPPPRSSSGWRGSSMFPAALAVEAPPPSSHLAPPAPSSRRRPVDLELELPEPPKRREGPTREPPERQVPQPPAPSAPAMLHERSSGLGGHSLGTAVSLGAVPPWEPPPIQRARPLLSERPEPVGVRAAPALYAVGTLAFAVVLRLLRSHSSLGVGPNFLARPLHALAPPGMATVAAWGLGALLVAFALHRIYAGYCRIRDEAYGGGLFDALLAAGGFLLAAEAFETT